ncbi:heme-degrading domain-containing protein [Photobacterium lipolyticum]|uniref:UPF0303 protein C9I89_03200 n=1 Tax=Photobacterium lipolyticum TaxID=266810 RepID=A0A2T3N2J0_9GAMM|nr:heme-degrading domain-containing protein [Photobacterium lipolyticum]PSW06558.1 heme-degrading domain-containing protein [Photobacterium lipolyticum]
MNDILNEIAAQEQRLQFGHFSHLRAWGLGYSIKTLAEKRGASVAIDITFNGQCLFFYAMPGTTIDNAEWIRRKRNVVHRYQCSSWYMGNACKAKEKTIEERSFVDPKEYAPYGGSFPLSIRNVGIVGAISVSGLPQAEDHQLIVDVLESFLSEDEKSEEK